MMQAIRKNEFRYCLYHMQQERKKMGGNENYEELKWSVRTILQVITSDDLYYGLFLVALLIILIKLVDLVFYPFRKRGSVLLSFMKGCIKVFLVVTIGMRICSLVPVLSDFTSQILMSSSLIVVVLGFVFQEGLSNIVHGFILTSFKPFKLGDRVRITLDGQSITGYIVSMNMRQTVIQNVINSSHVI
ncbi:MAG: mechanosensitive ion channel, partial [Lachnospiraceae bacterium]|nr:mechanosensitive ion channel [Lachnospiraceae bacterium]